MFFASILAATMLGISVKAQTTVVVQRAYVPVVVLGKGMWSLSQGAVNGTVDATQDQIDAVKARLVAAGVPADHLSSWYQRTVNSSGRFHSDEPKYVSLGIVAIDLGTPSEAPALAKVVAGLSRSELHFGWNQLARVDCNAMKRSLDDGITAAAQQAATEYAREHGGRAVLKSVLRTTDWRERYHPFDPIPMCQTQEHPYIDNAGAMAATTVVGSIQRFVAANAEITYTPPTAATDGVAPADAQSFYPFGTFGFPTRGIDYASRVFVLRGGRFAATPGMSGVSGPVDTILLNFYYDPGRVAQTLDALKKLGLSETDYSGDETTKHVWIRLHPVTATLLKSVMALQQYNTTEYKFVRDCAPYARYARSLATMQSERLARTAATAMHAKLGAAILFTDWVGAQSDAMCGSDGTGNLASVIDEAVTKGGTGYSGSDSATAGYWDSIYGAWTVGSIVPVIASEHIGDRSAPVVVGSAPGRDVTGLATLTPDAFFVQHYDNQNFTADIVKTTDGLPKGTHPGNVITDCEGAQRIAIEKAVKVAEFDGTVGSLYLQPTRFLSIACLDEGLIGHSFSSMPTMYNESSDTGVPQASQAATVYP